MGIASLSADVRAEPQRLYFLVRSNHIYRSLAVACVKNVQRPMGSRGRISERRNTEREPVCERGAVAGIVTMAAAALEFASDGISHLSASLLTWAANHRLVIRLIVSTTTGTTSLATAAGLRWSGNCEILGAMLGCGTRVTVASSLMSQMLRVFHRRGYTVAIVAVGRMLTSLILRVPLVGTDRLARHIAECYYPREVRA